MVDYVGIALLISLICNVVQSIVTILRFCRDEKVYHQQKKERRHLSGVGLDTDMMHPPSLIF
jgi:hypothetical protein